MRTMTLSFLAVLLLVGVAPLAHADGQGAEFGVLYGFSVPDRSDTNTYHLIGLKGEAFLTPSFSVGGYYLVSDKSGQQGSNKFTYSLHGIEGSYHFASSGGDSFVALRIGMTKVHASPNGLDVIYSPYHYGLACGYDYFVNSWLALGFEGSYLHVENGKSIQSGVLNQEDSFNVINFLVAVQVRI